MKKLKILEAVKNNANIQYLKTLLENGADPNEGDEIQFRFPICWAVDHKNLEIVKLLLRFGADVNKQTSTMRTSLMMAIANDTKEIFDLLLEKEPDLSLSNAYERNVIHIAASVRNYYLKKLLKKQPPIEIVNKRDENGKTPLIRALRYKKVENALELIRYQADLNVKTKNGEQAIDLIIQSKNTELFKALENRVNDLDERGKALFERTRLKFELI